MRRNRGERKVPEKGEKRLKEPGVRLVMSPIGPAMGRTKGTFLCLRGMSIEIASQNACRSQMDGRYRKPG